MAPRPGTRPPVPGTPPDWPAEVRPPGAPDWVRSAVVWLLDLCPADYRRYQVLNRHAVALAWIAVQHTRAAMEGNRRALSTMRVDLGGALEPHVLEQMLEVLRRERDRLAAAHRGAWAVGRALEGRRPTPRL
ncbi:MAG: hypothetical protein GXX79_06295 [Actinomycetales bacterium]|nr:hypothetical protein [Actinomycetales bacterium]